MCPHMGLDHEKKNKQECWVHEGQKTCSFHAEKDFIKKEFLNREEFMNYVVNLVSHGFKIQ